MDETEKEILNEIVLVRVVIAAFYVIVSDCKKVQLHVLLFSLRKRTFTE